MAWIGDPAVGDELAAGAPHGGRERSGPQVLVDQAPATLPGSIAAARLLDVLLGERLDELGLDRRCNSPELPKIAQLLGHDGAVLALLEDEDVHDPDGAGVMEAEQLVGALAGEVLRPRRELDDQEVDGPQLVERSFSHRTSILSSASISRYVTSMVSWAPGPDITLSG